MPKGDLSTRCALAPISFDALAQLIRHLAFWPTPAVGRGQSMPASHNILLLAFPNDRRRHRGPDGGARVGDLKKRGGKSLMRMSSGQRCGPDLQGAT